MLTGVLVLTAVGLTTFGADRDDVAWASSGASAPRCGGARRGDRAAHPSNVVGALLGLVGVAVAFTRRPQIGWRVLARHPQHSRPWTGWSRCWPRARSGCLSRSRCCCCTSRTASCRAALACRPLALVAAAFVHHAYGAVDPARKPAAAAPAHPFGPPPAVIEVLDVLAELTLLALLIACAASIVARYRRSDDVRRRQLRWLALAGIGVPGFVLVCGGEVLITGRAGWAGATVGVAAMFAIPVAVAIALLRHDLYDVDRALATTVAWALLTVIVLAVFSCASFVAGLVLGRDSTAAAAAATALTAVALSPLRRRLQRAVDRRLYPLRQAAFAAIDDLQRGIHVGAARPEQLAERLQVALHDPWLRVGYLIPGGSTLWTRAGHRWKRHAPSSWRQAARRSVLCCPVATAASPELLREVAAASVTTGRARPPAARADRRPARGRGEPRAAGAGRRRGAATAGARPA